MPEDPIDPDLIEMDPPDVPGERVVRPPTLHVGRSPEGEALAAQAAEARTKVLTRLQQDHGDLGARWDRATIARKGAEASLAEAEKLTKEMTSGKTAFEEQRVELQQKLAKIDRDTDPRGHEEVSEDIRIHEAAIARQDTLIKNASTQADELRATTTRLKAEEEALTEQTSQLGKSLSSAEAEIDKMEQRARLLDDEYNHTANARSATDRASEASARGDETEAAQLRKIAASELDQANVASRELVDVPLDPTVLESAGVAAPAPAVPEDDVLGVDAVSTGSDDLMDPNAPADPGAPTPDDTDLMDPNAPDAGSGGNDSDLMDPSTDGGNDTDLMDPTVEAPTIPDETDLMDPYADDPGSGSGVPDETDLMDPYADDAGAGADLDGG